MAVHFEKWDYTSMGAYLATSDELQKAVMLFAENIAVSAAAIAPIGPDDTAGEFKASIHAEPHSTSRGDIGARVVADSHDALWAEFGRKRETVGIDAKGRRYRRGPYEGSHALQRAGSAQSAPKRTA